MTEPTPTPPPRPRWVWVIVIVIVVAAATVGIVHLVTGGGMAGMHGMGMVTMYSTGGAQ
ncbi:MAG: hypothetical protein J0H96_14160 [Microbacterium ginsengisoli]|nr:hypothetical protein [Microbacterium ginsengisoli]